MQPLTIADAYRDLLRLRIATPEQIVGCTEDEIQQIKQRQNILHLPAFYFDFLRFMGHSAGNLFFRSGLAYYPDLLTLKNLAIAEPRVGTIPENAFVFLVDDERFMYFLTSDESDDAAVHCYDDNQFRFNYYGTYSEFLFERIDLAQAWNGTC